MLDHRQEVCGTLRGVKQVTIARNLVFDPPKGADGGKTLDGIKEVSTVDAVSE